MTNAPAPEPIQLSDEIKGWVNNAYENRTPMVVVYVDPDGQPSMSFRGTVQAWSDTQLALWARGTGNIQNNITDRPQMTLWYRDPAARTTLQFRGRARITDDPEHRTQIFDNSPAAEQAADPERKGIAMIVDLERVDGRTPAGPVVMRANA
ncbi:MAG: pyridoxamine 5'-phosphate oxidase family protein [Dehalococcoidia bacterium]